MIHKLRMRRLRHKLRNQPLAYIVLAKAELEHASRMSFLDILRSMLSRRPTSGPYVPPLTGQVDRFDVFPDEDMPPWENPANWTPAPDLPEMPGLPPVLPGWPHAIG